MLRHVALVRTDVSEEHSASIIRVTRIGELGTLAIIETDACCEEIHSIPSSPILVTLMMEALHSSETSIPTKATLLNIPEDGILHSHIREHLKSDAEPILSSGKLFTDTLPRDGNKDTT
jgi:hypothetical protein